MKALYARAYGGPEVLELREIDKPSIGDGEVLVKVKAAAIHKGDWHLLTGSPGIIKLMSGWSRPKNPVPGGDLAGIVEAVGSKVTRFKIGDEVFGGRDGFKDYGGSLAEFCRVPEAKLAIKATGISFEQAAGLGISGCTALVAVKKGGVKAGQSVLVNGASGGVGHFALQIARSVGATVTAVCSTPKISAMRELGANQVGRGDRCSLLQTRVGIHAGG